MNQSTTNTQVTGEEGVLRHEPFLPPFSIRLPETISQDPEASYDSDLELYSEHWVVLGPDIIIDPHLGHMWKLKLRSATYSL